MLEHNDHEAGVKRDLRELMTNESYWNVIIFCKVSEILTNERRALENIDQSEASIR